MMKDRLSLRLDSDGGFELRGEYTKLAGSGIIVEADGRRVEFDFGGRELGRGKVGETEGDLFSDAALSAGLRLRREVLLSSDATLAALRVAVRNESGSPVTLSKVDLINVETREGMLAGGDGISDWNVLRYPPFDASGLPASYRPAVVDGNFSDAIHPLGNGDIGEGTGGRTVISGPLTIFASRANPGRPRLMVAATDVRNHYVLHSLTTDEAGGFQEFCVCLDFINACIPPWGEVESHWVIVTTGEHESVLLERFAEVASAVQGVEPVSKPSPTVFCTWYFYTFMISEAYVLEELEAIERLGVPLDVFQIDDGWMDNYGTYEPHPVKFPRGMAFLADEIRGRGMLPGIWAAPFVIDVKSPVVERYPDMFQCDADGERLIFETDRDCYLLDITAPGAEDYLRGLCLKLKGWGYGYFKMDWLRAICGLPNAVLRDRGVNLVQGYYLAMEIIRETLGPEAFILGCGGISAPAALALVDGMRTSGDVRGAWKGPKELVKADAIYPIKQNLLRNFANRFYHTDPDATQIRIRSERFSDSETKCMGVYQSEGHYSDDEALTVCTHQYLSGGLITISERFPELQPERLAMLRHISPAITPPARILDYDAPVCPTLFATDIEPRCPGLGAYRTLTVGNWDDAVARRRLRLVDLPFKMDWPARVAVFEFHTQSFLGLFTPHDTIELEIPAHATRVLRIAAWDGDKPIVLGTDLHITGGAAEITELEISGDAIAGRVETRWPYPVVVTGGFPSADGGVDVVAATTAVGGGVFRLRRSG